MTRSGVVYDRGALVAGFDMNAIALAAQDRHEAYLAGVSDNDDDALVAERPLVRDPMKDDSAAAHEKGVSRNKMRFKTKRREARARTATKLPSKYINRVEKSVSKKRREEAEPLQTVFKLSPSLKSNNVASSAFVGRRVTNARRDTTSVPLTKEQALAMGLDLFTWDGLARVPVANAQGEIIAVLHGQPRNGWGEVLRGASRAYEKAKNTYHFKDSQLAHRRGAYPAITTGISYGGGQQKVSYLADTRHNHRVIEELVHDPAIRRLAGFADAAFLSDAPELYRFYAETLGRIIENDPSLEAPFDNSVLAGVTFNLGPNVSTVEHTDHLNYPAGWCGIIALGEFDPTEGGHLILWDLNLMIEFPPGSLIFIPSAILRHSNTSVRSHENRSSFTQYSAGGLFRWVECGFQSQKAFLATGGRMRMTGKQRWEEGVARFSTLNRWFQR